MGGWASRWEEERGEEGGGEGRGEERAAQQERAPSFAGFHSTVACCIVKYDNAGLSDRLSISHLKFTFKD